MNRKKIAGFLAVMLVAGVSLAGCQSVTDSPGSSVVASGLANRVILYQNAQPKELPIRNQEQFDALEQTVTQAIESAGDSGAPGWVSSVVTEEWLEESLEGGGVVKITFAATRDFTIGSEHRTCEELLVIQQGNLVVFGRDGQYQSGPLVVSSEQIEKIFENINAIPS